MGVGGGHRHPGGAPGALFWMWVSALLGMMTVYAENVLAARHRQAPGALGYIRAAGRWGKPLAAVYAGGCCLSSLGMGTMAQTHAAAASLSPLGVPAAPAPWGWGCWLFGWPGRAGPGGEDHPALGAPDDPAVFGASLWVLWVFRENIPRAVASIFQGAFSLKAGAGARRGPCWPCAPGSSRGWFTNEPAGSSAFAYQGVEGRSPEELGCLGIFQVFVDTLVMCTVTGLCILCCRCPCAGGGGQLAFYAFESALGPGAGGWPPCARRCSPWPPWWPGAAGAGKGCSTLPAAGGGSPMPWRRGGRPALGACCPWGSCVPAGGRLQRADGPAQRGGPVPPAARGGGRLPPGQRGGLPRGGAEKSLGEDSIKF